MRKKTAFIILSIFLLFSCKKSEVLIQDTNDDVMSVSTAYDNTKVKELVTVLGGKFIENYPLIDASVKSIKGKVTNLSDYKGKVIFLNLWATWCPPCREEMPTIEKLYKEFKGKDLQIIAVSQSEREETVEKFLKEFNYTFPIFTDHKSQIVKSYNSGAIPTTYIINKNGFIISQIVGARDWNAPEVKELFEELLKENSL